MRGGQVLAVAVHSGILSPFSGSNMSPASPPTYASKIVDVALRQPIDSQAVYRLPVTIRGEKTVYKSYSLGDL